jgi:hypothetical protein
MKSEKSRSTWPGLLVGMLILALGVGGIVTEHFRAPRPVEVPRVSNVECTSNATAEKRPLDDDFQRAMKADSERAAPGR